MALSEAMSDLGLSGIGAGMFANFARAFNIFLIVIIVGVVVSLCCWLVYTYIIKYKWKVLICIQRKGGNHYWMQDKGGNFKSSKKGVQYFRLLKNKVRLPPIPAEAVELMTKGKSLVFLYKYDTGSYDYLPFTMEPLKDEMRQKTFDIDMQNFVRMEMVSDLEKFKFREFIEKYQMMISVGAILLIFVIGLYAIYKMNQQTVDASSQLLKEAIDMYRTAKPVQVL